MSVLDKILARTRRAVAARAAATPISALEPLLDPQGRAPRVHVFHDDGITDEGPSLYGARHDIFGYEIREPEEGRRTNPYVFRSLAEALRAGEGPRIIAEHKRASPSEGDYDCPAGLAAVIEGYTAAGAVALSVLTEEERFGGSLAHLREARLLTDLPLLRKDFIIDEYQLYEAKAAGADAVLLIAAAITTDEARHLRRKAQQLSLEVLLEIHGVAEMDYLSIQPDVIGVNNRDLNTLKIDLRTSEALIAQLPTDLPRISESGISSAADAARLLSLGYDGLLVGTRFMKSGDPGAALATFLTDTRAAL